jgi:outer membrane receptor protein involved in Fe transport
MNSTDLSHAQWVFDTVTGMISSTRRGFNFTSPSSGYVLGQNQRVTPEQNNFAGYAQDSWKVRPDLTLQGGLRWEFQGVFDLRNKLLLQPDNRVASAFGPAGVGNYFTPTNSPAMGDVLLNFAGGRNNKPLYNTRNDNFAPFFGFAFDPTKDGKTAIRGGFKLHRNRHEHAFANAHSRRRRPVFVQLHLQRKRGQSQPVGVQSQLENALHTGVELRCPA